MRASYLAAGVMLLVMTIPASARPGGKDKAEGAKLVPKPGAKPESCIPLSQIRETKVRDDSTIDFILNGNRTMRNVLPHSCPQLGFEEKFGYATSLSQLCSTDIITVLITGGGGPGGLSRGASCGLGQFQEVVPAP